MPAPLQQPQPCAEHPDGLRPWPVAGEAAQEEAELG